LKHRKSGEELGAIALMQGPCHRVMRQAGYLARSKRTVLRSFQEYAFTRVRSTGSGRIDTCPRYLHLPCIGSGFKQNPCKSGPCCANGLAPRCTDIAELGTIRQAPTNAAWIVAAVFRRPVRSAECVWSDSPLRDSPEIVSAEILHASDGPGSERPAAGKSFAHLFC
jgi:hypothetical protein